MEWARKIVVRGGELVAEVESTTRQVNGLSLKELVKRGAPAIRPAIRHQLKVKFADFTPVSSQEYIAHFGMPEGIDDLHQVYELRHKSKRYLVPALILMRALFLPASKLLPQIFAPNVLERTCRLHWDDKKVSVVVDAPWASEAAAKRRCDSTNLLRWMMATPTARHMANSVHKHAMSGHIAIDLPTGSIEASFAGVQAVSAVMVTEMRILSVFPLDKPDLPVEDWVSRIDYLNRSWTKGRSLRESVSIDVPLRTCGAYELTDDEWSIISPILATGRKTQRPYQHCPRKMLDGIIGKLATGRSWRDSQYEVGDWRNAATVYHRWTSRGTFTRVLEALRELR